VVKRKIKHGGISNGMYREMTAGVVPIHGDDLAAASSIEEIMEGRKYPAAKATNLQLGEKAW